jgi:predicted DNA-binding protein (UPF0251 family)
MKTVGVNELGRRVGQDHQNAKLTDREVEMIRTLHSEGMGYKCLAEKFGVAKSTVASICKYQRRGQVPVEWVRVEV